MVDDKSRYRFLLIEAFHLKATAKHSTRNFLGPKEETLMNFKTLKPLLDTIEWERDPGPEASYGDWPVETREEFDIVSAARLPIVRKACESGKYNGIVLLGGGEPGFLASREIGHHFGIPVTSCAYSQMHMASTLGHKFSVVDLAENHNMYYYDLVLRHQFADRCASIRNINFPLPRPPYTGETTRAEQMAKMARGEKSEMVEAAVVEAVAAIEEDGADVITFGCSGTFWLQPHLKQRLSDMGWDVPVLEGYSCAITLCKALVDLGVTVSGTVFPADRPKKIRRKKMF
jgi:allantoin racemase